jgi:hypothetical protein
MLHSFLGFTQTLKMRNKQIQVHGFYTKIQNCLRFICDYCLNRHLALTFGSFERNLVKYGFF